MLRGAQSRSHPSLLFCACLAGVALAAAAPAQAAGPSAVEEYVLTLPGVERSEIQGPTPIEESADRIGPVGVVGEQSDDFTRIGAVGAAAASPGGAAAILLAAGGIALALVRSRKRV